MCARSRGSGSLHVPKATYPRQRCHRDSSDLSDTSNRSSLAGFPSQCSRLADNPSHCSRVAGMSRSLPATVETLIYSGLKKRVHSCRAFYMYKQFKIILVELVYNFKTGHVFLLISTCLRNSVGCPGRDKKQRQGCEKNELYFFQFTLFLQYNRISWTAGNS